MTRGSLCFLDTNVLLGATDTGRVNHAACRVIVEAGPSAGIHFVVTGQIIREYLTVATRPTDGNGFGMEPAAAIHNVDALLTRMHVLPENAEVARNLVALVRTHSISGKRIHDANVLAAMSTHGVQNLITANLDDYEGMAAAVLLGPAEAAARIEALAEPR